MQNASSITGIVIQFIQLTKEDSKLLDAFVSDLHIFHYLCNFKR